MEFANQRRRLLVMSSCLAIFASFYSNSNGLNAQQFRYGLARQIQLYNPQNSSASYNRPAIIYALRPQATLPPLVTGLFVDNTSQQPIAARRSNPIEELLRRRRPAASHRRARTVAYAGSHVRTAEDQCPPQVLHVAKQEVRISACNLRGQSFTRVKIIQYDQQQGKVALKLPYASQYRTKTDVTNLFRIEQGSGFIYYYGRNINPGEKAHIRIFIEGKIRNTPCTYTNHIDVLFHCLPTPVGLEAAAPKQFHPRRRTEAVAHVDQPQVQTINAYFKDSRAAAAHQQEHQQQQQAPHSPQQQMPDSKPTFTSVVVEPTQQQPSFTKQRHAENVAEVNADNQKYAEKLARENQQQQNLQEKPFVFHKIDDIVRVIKPFWTRVEQQEQLQQKQQQQASISTTTAPTTSAVRYYEQNPKRKIKLIQRGSENESMAWDEDAIKTRPYMKPYNALEARSARIADWNFSDLTSMLADAFSYGFDTFGYPGFHKTGVKYSMENGAPI